MQKRRARRKRLAALTGGLAVLFLLAVALVVTTTAGRREVYRPGQAVKGLTAGLSRDLPADHPRVVFTDVTEHAGIRFRHFSGRRSSQLPEDMGSGAAWGDYDGDGWLDLYVVNLVGPLDLSPAGVDASPARSHLYHNQRDGTFRELAEEAGVAFRGWGMAAAWGDYDGDGHLDLVVTAYGSNILYRNRGDGMFVDVTREAGLHGPEGFWSGASWADYDRDGDLDLYITGYVRYEPAVALGTSRQYDVDVPPALNPSAFAPERNLLYRNEGDGTFTEVAEAAGVAGDLGRSLSAAWSDLDEDGWPDLYISNDVSDNVLYHNRGDGTFGDVSHGALVADYRGAMGLAIGDWNGDGDMDIFVSHWIAQENALYDNKVRREFVSLETSPTRGLQFMDEADRWGLGQIALDFIGWGTSFLDFDNDGRPDLVVANGSTMQEPGDPHLLTPMRDLLFWNRGPEHGFYDISSAAGPYFREERVGRGVAVADYDNDGDLDVFIVNHGDQPVLLRNDGGNRNHWLSIQLEGSRANRQAIGARVRVLVDGRVGVQEVGAQSSYLSQNSTVAHFGLGRAEVADTIEVAWPGGERQRFYDVPAGRRFRLVEGGALEEAEAGTAARVAEGASATALPESVGRERVLQFWAVFREATTHRVAGRVAEAEAGYARALELDPNHEDALYYLGNMRLEGGDFDGAWEAWERLVQVNPMSARAHGRLADLHACLAPGAPYDPERADTELRRMLEINPEQTGPRLGLAVVAILRGTPAEADRHLDRVLGSDRQSGLAHFLKGYLAWKRGDRAEAQARLMEAVAASRPSAPAGGVAGEGDTRHGGGAMLDRTTPCREVPSEADGLMDLAELTGPALERELEARYTRLDALMNRRPPPHVRR